jgi:hypothetical protein
MYQIRLEQQKFIDYLYSFFLFILGMRKEWILSDKE